MLLFVYGSLKRNFWNHFFLRSAKFVGTYHTKDHFCLIINRELPFVSTTPSLYPIIGEVYEVDDDTLRSIDCLENNGKWYTRRNVEVVSEDDKSTLVCQLYFNDGATGEIQSEGIFLS